ITAKGLRVASGGGGEESTTAGYSPGASALGQPQARVLWVLIASPSDVAAERAAAVEAIERWNNSVGKQTDVLLAPSRWEVGATPGYANQPQDRIDSELVDAAHLVVGIFWSRMGSPTPDAPSATAHELERAAAQNKPVMVYFCDRPIPPAQIDPAQIADLRGFRQALEERALVATFATRDELQTQLIQHFTNAVAELGAPMGAGAGRGVAWQPDEIVQLVREQMQWSDEDHRPTFERTDGAMTTLAAKFQPQWRIRQASGDYISQLKWRFCGPRFQMEWRHASGSSLARTAITEVFDVAKPPRAAPTCVGTDELGLEIRYHWRGKFRKDIHRWPLKFTERQNGMHCDVGREILPVSYADEEEESEDALGGRV
ncbi:MAG: hypothetical protein WEC33_07620, partial [Dehalococcoidia bacterium]